MSPTNWFPGSSQRFYPEILQRYDLWAEPTNFLLEPVRCWCPPSCASWSSTNNLWITSLPHTFHTGICSQTSQLIRPALLDCIDCSCDVFFRIFHREEGNKLITFVTWLRPVLLIGKFLPLGDKKNLEWSYKGFLWKHCAEEVTFQRNFLIWNFHIYTIVSSNVGCQNIAKFG